MVSAYCEEPVAYCLVAALESAERRGCRRACIVARELSRRLCVREGIANGVVVELVLSEHEAATHMAGLLRLGQSQNFRVRVPSAPDTSTKMPRSLRS
jgi:hypothetical protein